LGHEKEMKGWRDQFTLINHHSIEQAQTISVLKRKINRLELQVDALTSIVKRIK
jgi:hypothetical protein